MELKAEYFTIAEYPKAVGYYAINNGLFIDFTCKPSLFHRIMTRIFLGWVWHDKTEVK